MRLKKKETKDLFYAKELKKFLRSSRGFGSKVCEELVFDCGNCMGQTLVGFLNWYIDLVEFRNRPKKK